MAERSKLPWLVLALTSLGAVVAVGTKPVAAEEILYLTNGRHIRVDRYWEEDDQVFYERDGNVVGFPRRLLERVHRVRSEAVESDDALPPSGFRNEIVSETVAEARLSADEGDFDRAAGLYRRAIDKAPDSVQSRFELAELYFQRGDLYAAQSQLEQAKRLAPEDARVRELLGDVYYRRGRTPLAIREWQRALSNAPTSALLYKLKRALRENDDDIDFEEVERPNFVIRYDGHVNERLGRLAAAALDEEYYELSQELRFSPRAPVRVTLYTNREFRDVTHAPEWASALNDGEIRIPVEGVTVVTNALRRVLRHELSHSFIESMTAGNCPAWFHEGVAQLLEGELRMDPYPKLREAKASGRLLPLWSLEGSLLHYSKDKARLAYAESAAAVEYLEARRGREGIVRILKLLGEQQTMNDVLKRVVGLDYQELQTAWEADLTRYRPPAR